MDLTLQRVLKLTNQGQYRTGEESEIYHFICCCCFVANSLVIKECRLKMYSFEGYGFFARELVKYLNTPLR